MNRFFKKILKVGGFLVLIIGVSFPLGCSFHSLIGFINVSGSYFIRIEANGDSGHIVV